jgi:predicted phosphodiesterase
MLARIALVADIHGNTFALEHVLREIERESVDRIVCLGDIAVLGPDPDGSITRIREAASHTVLGNVDRWLVNRLRDDRLAGPDMDEMRRLAAWSLERISAENLAWLNALPMTATIDESVLLFHGSPHSCDDVISALTPDDEVRRLIPHGTGVAIGGHIHIQLLRRVGSLLLINPGSVGLPGVGPGTPDLPVNRGVTWADYAMLTIREDTRSVDFRRTPLPMPAMLAWARSMEMPGFDWWAQRWSREAADL